MAEQRGKRSRNLIILAVALAAIYIAVKAAGVLYMDRLLVSWKADEIVHQEATLKQFVAVGNGESFAQAIVDNNRSGSGGDLLAVTHMDGGGLPLFLRMGHGSGIDHGQIGAYDDLKENFGLIKPRLYAAAREAYRKTRAEMLTDGRIFRPFLPAGALHSSLWNPDRTLPRADSEEEFAKLEYELWLSISPILPDGSHYLTFYFRPMGDLFIAISVYVKDDDFRATASDSPTLAYYQKVGEAVRKW